MTDPERRLVFWLVVAIACGLSAGLIIGLCSAALAVMRLGAA